MRLNVTQLRRNIGSLELTALALVALSACSAKVTEIQQNQASASAGANAVAGWAECSEALGLDDPAVAGSCKSARTFLKCSDGQMCLSDSSEQCPQGAPLRGSCQVQCNPNEYAVSCGGAGVSSNFMDAPTGCHNPQLTSVGIVFYCCPCTTS
jgi:hypothetical protein